MSNIYLPQPNADLFLDSTGLFFRICKCERWHQVRLNGRIKLSTVLEDTRGILYCLLRLRGDEEPPLSQCSSAPAHKHRCSAVCVFQCSSRHSWLQLFVLHPLSSPGAHTHNLLAFKTNMQLHKDSYTLTHTPLHNPQNTKTVC